MIIESLADRGRTTGRRQLPSRTNAAGELGIGRSDIDLQKVAVRSRNDIRAVPQLPGESVQLRPVLTRLDQLDEPLPKVSGCVTRNYIVLDHGAAFLGLGARGHPLRTAPGAPRSRCLTKRKDIRLDAGPHERDLERCFGDRSLLAD